MLKVVGISEFKSETLDLNGYTLTLRLNRLQPFGHVFWRTGNFRDSILEIGLNDESHAIEVVKIVNIQRSWVSSEEIVDFSNPQLSKQEGLPIMQWTWDKPSPRVMNENGFFTIHISEKHLSIQIGSASVISKTLVAQRTMFGVDDAGNLVAIQITNLQPKEIAVVRSTFERTSHHSAD